MSVDSHFTCKRAACCMIMFSYYRTSAIQATPLVTTTAHCGVDSVNATLGGECSIREANILIYPVR